MNRDRIKDRVKNSQKPLTRHQEERLNRNLETKLRLVDKVRTKPGYQSKFAQQLEQWADQLDAEIEMLKNL